jgi:hypothetical protein
MARLERRLERLEQASGARKVALDDWLTVDLRPALRAVAFRLYGFDIEEIDAPPFMLPSKADLNQPVRFREIRALGKRHGDLMQNLMSLDHEAREKLARRHGYHILQPKGA